MVQWVIKGELSSMCARRGAGRLYCVCMQQVHLAQHETMLLSASLSLMLQGNREEAPPLGYKTMTQSTPGQGCEELAHSVATLPESQPHRASALASQPKDFSLALQSMHPVCMQPAPHWPG